MGLRKLRPETNRQTNNLIKLVPVIISKRESNFHEGGKEKKKKKKRVNLFFIFCQCKLLSICIILTELMTVVNLFLDYLRWKDNEKISF